MRWLVAIVTALGLGATVGQIENLDSEMGLIAQVVSCTAIVFLALWRKLPDENRNQIPDVIEPWPKLVRVLKMWVFPIAVAVAMALGVAAAGCGRGSAFVSEDGVDARYETSIFGLPFAGEVRLHRGPDGKAVCVKIGVFPPACVKL